MGGPAGGGSRSRLKSGRGFDQFNRWQLALPMSVIGAFMLPATDGRRGIPRIGLAKYDSEIFFLPRSENCRTQVACLGMWAITVHGSNGQYNGQRQMTG